MVVRNHARPTLQAKNQNPETVTQPRRMYVIQEGKATPDTQLWTYFPCSTRTCGHLTPAPYLPRAQPTRSTDNIVYIHLGSQMRQNEACSAAFLCRSEHHLQLHKVFHLMRAQQTHAPAAVAFLSGLFDRARATHLPSYVSFRDDLPFLVLRDRLRNKK